MGNSIFSGVQFLFTLGDLVIMVFVQAVVFILMLHLAEQRILLAKASPPNSLKEEPVALFQKGPCTVWSFTDQIDTHYAIVCAQGEISETHSKKGERIGTKL